MNNYHDEFLNSPVLAIDTETKDPLLTTKGPGCYRKDGYVIGVSLATPSGLSSYFPFAHPDTTPEERERNLRFIADIVSKPRTYIGANLMYDLDWLQNTSCPYSKDKTLKVEGIFLDVQWAAPLLNENERRYSLDDLARYYRLPLKKKSLPQEWADMRKLKGDVRKYLWTMPAKIVDEYAAYDSLLSLRVYDKQKPELLEQELFDLFLLEMENLPLLLAMRKTGVRIDLPRIKQVSERISERLQMTERKLKELTGNSLFSCSRSRDIAAYLDRAAIEYPRKEPTEHMRAKGATRGNPQLDKEFLLSIADKVPFAKLALQWRHDSVLINTFLIPYLSLRVGDRLHCQFNPLRTNEFGTVSGRFSASYPNLQQVPGREESDEDSGLSGKIIRELFIPEDGMLWARADYSQEEYRLLAHYAVGPGADDIRAEYCNNPRMDAHQRVVDKTGYTRKAAKNLNFGLVYGMGARAYAKKFGVSEEEAALMLESLQRASPYAKPTYKKVMNVAEQRGYIKTLLGRRARVHPSRKIHSMLNRLLQGSGGDIIKKALVDCRHKGLFDVLIPHITVHDEIDVSMPQTKEGEDALKEMVHTMETCVTLKVPLLVDCKTGANWSEGD